MPTVPIKPLYWIGRSLKDLKAMPVPVQKAVGTALRSVQLGGHPLVVKPLKGFGGAGVLEIVEDYDRSTFRVVYAVRLAGVVYVLHVFQKKSKSGIATPKRDLDLVRSRLRLAQEHYAKIVREGD